VRPLPKADGSPALRGGNAPKSPRIASYKIDAKLDALHHTITGTETLTWTNPGPSPVDTLPFHLYLNAFKNESSLFMRTSRGAMRGAKSTQDGWGWIKVESVQLAGTELLSQWKTVPQDDAPADETVAELHLPSPAQPGVPIELTIRFSEQLPEVFARTGYKGDFHLVGQWFPKIGVRDGESWECRPLSINTEFFADFGTYDVALTVPATEVVAATGVLTAAVDAPGGMRTLTYHAEDVHDFVWMADPTMEVMSGQAKLEDGVVEVRVYYRPEQRDFAKRHLESGIGAIQRFSSRFVSYPWSIMSIVDPPPDATDGAGGMEYPTLVTTAGDTVFARPGMRLPEYVTVHEVGHNWFQGILASNEPVEAWMDEGVNEWADALVMADLYGPRTSGVDWMGWQAELGALRRAADAGGIGPLPSPIATAAWAFVDSDAYAGETYTGTMRALETLQAYVGPARFDAAMKAYAKQWAFKHPTGRDLFASLSASLGQDLGWFFEPAFHELGGLQLQLRSADCTPYHDPRGIFDEKGTHVLKSELQSPDTGGWTCEVVVTNTGDVHIPVDIDLKFADGSTQRVRWEDKGHGAWERFVVKRSSKLAEVWLDPDAKLALDNPIQHHVRLEGDGAASLRAGAWFGSVALTIMQVLGP
jgi:hypothetical protein